jgi:hypothetical protein
MTAMAMRTFVCIPARFLQWSRSLLKASAPMLAAALLSVPGTNVFASEDFVSPACSHEPLSIQVGCVSGGIEQTEVHLFKQSKGRARVVGRYLHLKKDDGRILRLPRFQTEIRDASYYDAIGIRLMGVDEALGFWLTGHSSDAAETGGLSLVSMTTGESEGEDFSTIVSSPNGRAVVFCPKDGWADMMWEGGPIAIFDIVGRGHLKKGYVQRSPEWETTSCAWRDDRRLIVEQRSCRDPSVADTRYYACSDATSPTTPYIRRRLHFTRSAAGWVYHIGAIRQVRQKATP